MSGERSLTIFSVVLMTVVGVAAWWITLRPSVAEDPISLRDFSFRLHGWRGVDIPLDDAVESMLRADYHIQRVYRSPLGGSVFLYVGYYGTRRGGTPEHTPGVCYPAQGWSIVADRRVPLNGSPGMWAREFVVQQGREKRLVHFWYRTYRQTGIASGLSLRLSHMIDRLIGGRADGSLVRLSTPIGSGNIADARVILSQLHPAVERELARVWPEPAPAGGGIEKIARRIAPATVREGM